MGPVRHRAIDSSELRLTTDREGRQVGQHRSHIVAAVSSAWLIARAAASSLAVVIREPDDSLAIDVAERLLDTERLR